MEGLHNSTNDLRNKLSKGHINNNHPIITQVMVGNVTDQGQVRVGDLSMCRVLLKEMNLQNKIFILWMH